MFSNCFFLFSFFFQICENSGIQMACPLDLWLFGVGQHKTTSSLCLPQSETEISIWPCAGLPVCRREKLNGSVKDILYFIQVSFVKETTYISFMNHLWMPVVQKSMA